MISLAGHDMGRIYLTVSVEDNSVFVCDGKKHRLNRPKRKNKKHVCLIFADKSVNVRSMTDGALRKLLKEVTQEYERIIN